MFAAARTFLCLLLSTGSPLAFGYAERTLGHDGNRTASTDAENQTTTFTFDARHRLDRIEHPGSDEERFEHDGEGNATVHVDGNGQRIESTYDALNRRVARDYTAAAAGDVAEETWDLDGNGNIERIEQRVAGGPVHITERTWNPQERLAEETDRHGQRTTHAYDAHGNRIRRDDAAGLTAYQPDRLHRTAAVSPAGGGESGFAYSAEGRLLTLTQPNGARTEHAYDAAGRLEVITHHQGGTVVATTTYAYDANGNRTGETTVDASGTRTRTYTVDRDDRLTAIDEQAPDGTTTRTTYQLDDVGNRTQETVQVNGATVQTVASTYGDRQQLDQRNDSLAGLTTFAYDGKGHLVEETACAGRS